VDPFLDPDPVYILLIGGKKAKKHRHRDFPTSRLPSLPSVYQLWLGGLIFFTPSSPNTLKRPMVKPYFNVSKSEAIGAGCGFGPQIAIAPMRHPQRVVRTTTHKNIRLNWFFTRPSRR
jgi:hypothetical protein